MTRKCFYAVFFLVSHFSILIKSHFSSEKKSAFKFTLEAEVLFANDRMKAIFIY